MIGHLVIYYFYAQRQWKGGYRDVKKGAEPLQNFL